MFLFVTSARDMCCSNVRVHMCASECLCMVSFCEKIEEKAKRVRERAKDRKWDRKDERNIYICELIKSACASQSAHKHRLLFIKYTICVIFFIPYRYWILLNCLFAYRCNTTRTHTTTSLSLSIFLAPSPFLSTYNYISYLRFYFIAAHLFCTAFECATLALCEARSSDCNASTKRAAAL